MKCIIYTRYSPQRKGDEKQSCEVQTAYCEELAAKKGWKIGGIYEDKEKSGQDDTRPGLWTAIQVLEKGDVLLVWKLDRLARSVYLMERIRHDVEAHGAQIVAVKGDVEGNTPEAIMVRQILSAVAEYERKIISQRTSAAMIYHMKNGKRISSKPPYGYRFIGDTMEAVEKEQKAIYLVSTLRKENKDVLAIVRAMNASEHRTRTGRQWMRRDVENIISILKE